MGFGGFCSTGSAREERARMRRRVRIVKLDQVEAEDEGAARSLGALGPGIRGTKAVR
jgi:hypothetical protein